MLKRVILPIQSLLRIQSNNFHIQKQRHQIGVGNTIEEAEVL